MTILGVIFASNTTMTVWGIEVATKQQDLDFTTSGIAIAEQTGEGQQLVASSFEDIKKIKDRTYKI